MPTPRGWWITPKNLIRACVFVAVRHCIDATWINDRDQFMYPNDSWENDNVFQSNCLVNTLFHKQNNISSSHGINHWIPFTEEEVDAKERFDSHFMSDYIKGKRQKTEMTAEQRKAYESDGRNYVQTSIFDKGTQDVSSNTNEPIAFSPEAQAVMDAGRELWRYYHQQPIANPNASLYDIRLHFQGTKTTKSGKVQMNSDSSDEKYMQLITSLREKQKALAKKIEPKVYEDGFLKG